MRSVALFATCFSSAQVAVAQEAPRSEARSLPPACAIDLATGLSPPTRFDAIDAYAFGIFAPEVSPPVACFDGLNPPAPEVVESLERAMRGYGARYVVSARWTATAAGSVGPAGNPAILTYSLVPDGVIIPGQVFEPDSANALFLVMNARFGGNTALWQAKVDQAFAAWSLSTGVRFVRVPDDGAPWPGSPGQTGARGDIRLACHPIDGGGGVLAAARLPTIGDIVLDSSENWGSPGNDYRFLRNVLAHEVGHALGLGHVWPTESTKLMEPFYFSDRDGPQDDDLRGCQRNYGDPDENNDTPAAATGLGELRADSNLSRTRLSLDAATDADYFAFSLPQRSLVAAAAAPVGGTYFVGPASGSTTLVNSLAVQSLSVQLLSTSGDLLAQSPSHAAGTPGEVPGTTLTAGDYVVRVSSPPGSSNDVQRYTLTLTAAAAAPCFADFNQDGGIDGADVDAFFDAWENGESGADVNEDGGIDGTDVSAFFDAWESGGCG